MRFRQRRRVAFAALVPLFAATSLLVPGRAGADVTQSNGCLGVTNTFSTFSIPISGAATITPGTANPGKATVGADSITLTGLGVTVGVDAALINAGISTGLVSAAPDLAHIGVSKISSPADGTTTADALGGVSEATVQPGKVTLRVAASNVNEAPQVATNTAAAGTTFYVTGDVNGGGINIWSSVSNPTGGLDPARTGVLLAGSLPVVIPLDGHKVGAVVTAGPTAWTPTGGDVVFTELNTAPVDLLHPSAADKTAAPLILASKINGIVSVPFNCWPGSVAAGTGMPLTPGTSGAIASAAVIGGAPSVTTTTVRQTSTTLQTAATTTSTSPTTTTPGAVEPETVSATGTYDALCSNSVTPDKSTMKFVLAATAPFRVAPGSPVTLADQAWTVKVPGAVLDTGLNLGLLTVGQTIPGTVAAAVSATNTVELAQTASDIAVSVGPVQLDPDSGLALDAATNFAVPNLTFTSDGEGDVEYSLAPSTIVVTLGALKVKFSCSPDPASAPLLRTKVSGVSTATAATASTPAQVLGLELPRTGSATPLEICLGILLLDVGYLTWSSARRRRD